MNKKIEVSEIRAGRIYSFVYDAEVKLNKGGRAGVAPNPLHGHVIEKHCVYAGQAATEAMYAKAWETLNGAPYTPAPDYTPRWTPTSNPCVVCSNATGESQLRVINPRKVGQVSFRVDGKPATEEQLALIAMYTPAKAERDGVKIMFPYVSNLLNVVE